MMLACHADDRLYTLRCGGSIAGGSGESLSYPVGALMPINASNCSEYHTTGVC